MFDVDIYALPFLEITLDKEHTTSLTVFNSKTILREKVSQTCKTVLEFCLKEKFRIISYWTWILQQNWELQIGFCLCRVRFLYVELRIEVFSKIITYNTYSRNYKLILHTYVLHSILTTFWSIANNIRN